MQAKKRCGWDFSSSASSPMLERERSIRLWTYQAIITQKAPATDARIGRQNLPNGAEAFSGLGKACSSQGAVVAIRVIRT